MDYARSPTAPVQLARSVTTYALVCSRRYRPYSWTKRDDEWTVFFPRRIPNSFGSAQVICSQDLFAGESAFRFPVIFKNSTGGSRRKRTRPELPVPKSRVASRNDESLAGLMHDGRFSRLAAMA